jgi:hypothetical protein
MGNAGSANRLRLVQDAAALASHFGRLHWAPLVDESRAYLRALGECMELLTTAERKTGY